MAMQEEMNEITQKVSEYLAQILQNEQLAIAFSENPLDVIEAEFGGEDLSGLDVGQAVQGACGTAGITGEAQQSVEATLAQFESGEAITLEQLVKLMSENVEIVYEDNDYITTNIDQSLNIHGEVHGNVEQANVSDVTNATGQGSVAVGGDMVDSQIQSQTGDGVQVGGDNTGAANVGDNSGQMAGGNADANNITSGDNANVASQGSAAGEGAINMADAHISDSAVEFGEGDNTQTDTTVADSHNQQSESTNVDYDSTYDSHNEGTYDSHNEATATDNSSYDYNETYDDHSQQSDDDTADIDQHAGDDAWVGDVID